MSFPLDPIEKRMKGALESLRTNLSGLRTGRASAGLLEPVQVLVHGSMQPLKAVASVSVPEPRLLSVSVWDRDIAGAVEKAIRDSNLGLNPVREGTVIRVPIPDLSEERRKELAKVAHGYAEDARVAVRNVRRDALDQLKKLEKDGGVSKDEVKGHSDKVQKLTDGYIKQVDEAVAAKEKEIRQI